MALIVLQSCIAAAQTLGPDEFSLCQYLGLANPTNETSYTGALLATPSVQSTELTGKYPDIEYIPIYPGSIPRELKNGPKSFTLTGNLKVLTLSAPASTTELLKFYTDAFAKNGWIPAGDPLPLTASTGSYIDEEYVWNDPTAALPWHMWLDIYVGHTEGNTTVVQLKYERLPDINKNLPVVPDASNITSSCSENFVINTYKLDKSYKATVQKTYFTQANPQQVSDYYSTTLPQYGWLDNYGTFEGELISPPADTELRTQLDISTSPAEGGGTKVELTQSVHRYIIQPIDSPVREITPTPQPK
jgi:hypothetical protein